MLKIEVKNDRIQCAEIVGSVGDIAAELGAVIARIYKDLKSAPAGVDEAFRKMVVCLIADPTSPVWKSEEEREGEE